MCRPEVEIETCRSKSYRSYSKLIFTLVFSLSIRVYLDAALKPLTVAANYSFIYSYLTHFRGVTEKPKAKADSFMWTEDEVERTKV